MLELFQTAFVNRDCISLLDTRYEKASLRAAVWIQPTKQMRCLHHTGEVLLFPGITDRVVCTGLTRHEAVLCWEAPEM